MSNHSNEELVVIYETPYAPGSAAPRRSRSTKPKIRPPSWFDKLLMLLLRRQVLLPVLALVVLTGTIAYQWHVANDKGSLPSELQGVWRNSLPAYEGRGFEFADTTLTFYLGEFGKRSYAVQGAETIRQADVMRVIVSYADVGGTYTLSFDVLDNGKIIFPNRDRIEWAKGNTKPELPQPRPTQVLARQATAKVSPLPITLLNCIQEINREARHDGQSISCAHKMEDSTTAQVMVIPAYSGDDPLAALYNVKPQNPARNR